MSDYETMQRRRSFIVGLFVIIAIVAFFWLIFKFGDMPGIVSEVKSFEVKVQFASAPGVQRDTPVRFCGYQIGRVEQVLEPAVRKDLNTGQYYFQSLVIAGIDNQYLNKIPKTVEVKLMTRGLGSSYIEMSISPKSVEPGTEFIAEGSLLQGATGVSSEFIPEATQKKLEELVSKITLLVNNTNEIVGNSENKANIQKILSNIANAAQEANDLMARLMEAVEAGKSTIQKADASIDQLTISFVDTSDKLGKVMTNLNSIVDKVNSGQGTMGKLVNDGRLYEQLLEDSRQIDLILKDIKSFVEESKKKGLPIKLK